jgi:hypothetical protein
VDPHGYTTPMQEGNEALDAQNGGGRRQAARG